MMDTPQTCRVCYAAEADVSCPECGKLACWDCFDRGLCIECGVKREWMEFNGVKEDGDE